MEEEIIVCPFDTNHQVRSSRFESHIIKCKKQYANQGIDMCPFNAKHVMPRNMMRNHIGVCPDRSKLSYESSIQQNLKTYEQNYPDIDSILSGGTTTSSHNPFDDDENWDDHVKQVNVIQPRQPIRPITDSYIKLAPKQRKLLKSTLVDDFKRKKNDQELKQREN